MRIRIGYDLTFSSSTPTPTILLLSVHPSRLNDLTEPHRITFDPPISSQIYTGNICTRIVMPPSTLGVSSNNVISDTGLPDVVEPDAGQIPVENLPDESLEFLPGSRYCETDRLSDTAWSLFGRMPPGWARVQAICDYVHDRLTFSYADARSTRTAWDGHQEGIGVCRDFAHLSIALCRCMNIPARYCTGYLGYRCATGSGPDGLQRVVRGSPRGRLVYLRRAAQSAADRSDTDRTRPRCCRRCVLDQLRSSPARSVQGHHRRATMNGRSGEEGVVAVISCPFAIAKRPARCRQAAGMRPAAA
jgi:hypothetical protein